VTTMVNFDFTATDVFENTLTYTAIGLPDGVGIDEDDAWFDEPYVDEEAEPGLYEVEIQVTDGYATDSRFLTIEVWPWQQRVAKFAINNTRVHSDDVGFIGQPLPVKLMEVAFPIEEYPGSMFIKVMEPDGYGGFVDSEKAWLTTDPMATSGDYEIELGWNYTTQFYVVPEVESEEDDDIVLVASWQEEGEPKVQMGLQKMVMLDVEIGTAFKMEGENLVPDTAKNKLIYADTTPTAMVTAGRYRIPPRKGTKLWVKLSLALPAGKELLLAQQNRSDAHGWTQLAKKPVGQADAAWIDDPYITLKPGDFNANTLVGDFLVRGKEDLTGAVFQTKEGQGNAKQLKLGVFGGVEVNGEKQTYMDPRVLSEGFSVSSIPLKVTLSHQGATKLKHPNIQYWVKDRDRVITFHWGTNYSLTFDNDSGDPKNLGSSVLISEDIQVVTEKGIFKTFPLKEEDTSNGVFGYNNKGDKHGISPRVQTAKTKREERIEELFQLMSKAIDALTEESTFSATQRWLFYDQRTGMTKADAIPIAKSGFTHSRKVTKEGDDYAMLLEVTPTNLTGASNGSVAGPNITLGTLGITTLLKKKY